MSLSNKADLAGEFVRLFATHNRTLYKHILTLLGNAEAAQEVFQETSCVMWEKFEEFTPGSNFVAWARRVGYFEVLKYRQTAARDRLLFNDTVTLLLAEQHNADTGMLEERRKALRECLKKLRIKDQELIDLRYSGEVTLMQIAEQKERPVNALYKSLARIRQTLFKCIDNTIAREGFS